MKKNISVNTSTPTEDPLAGLRAIIKANAGVSNADAVDPLIDYANSIPELADLINGRQAMHVSSDNVEHVYEIEGKGFRFAIPVKGVDWVLSLVEPVERLARFILLQLALQMNLIKSLKNNDNKTNRAEELPAPVGRIGIQKYSQ